MLINRAMRRAARACENYGAFQTGLKIDVLAEALYGSRDLWLIPFLCHKSRRSIDIGAADGLYTKIMVKYSQDVIAFEPNPVSYQRLTRRFPSLWCENCALSSTVKSAALRVPVVNGIPYRGYGTMENANRLLEFSAFPVQEISIPSRTLDSYKLSNIGFVKIDVEGHEWEVLTGARSTIAESRPNFMIEIEERHCKGNFIKVNEFFQELGYSGSFC